MNISDEDDHPFSHDLEGSSALEGITFTDEEWGHILADARQILNGAKEGAG